MKYLLVIMVLISANLMASQNCETIHINDSCHPSGNYLSTLTGYSFKISITCETQSNEEYKKTVEFSSLSFRASINCRKFEEIVSTHDLSIDELNILIESTRTKNQPKIKTIGSSIPSHKKITKARMNSMKSTKNKALSSQDQIRHRRQ